jgi:4-hydroxy-tetrahydrodipicolinate reductase
MLNVILNGCNGTMGKVVSSLIEKEEEMRIVCGFDINDDPRTVFPVLKSPAEFEGEAGVMIDFSHYSCTEGLLNFAVSKKIPTVIATTGLMAEQTAMIRRAAGSIPVFFSANMSIGVNLMLHLVRQAARVLEGDFDIEVIEKHHNQKLDAPSGTALSLVDAVSSVLSFEPEYEYDRHSKRKKRGPHEIGIHSLRGGTIVGEHSVLFAGRDEVLEIRHTAASKEVFAIGAIRAAKFIAPLPSGLYNMENLVNSI